MEQFDERLRDTAEKEEIIVPEGFDERMREVLDDLPSQAKRRGLGAVKGVLIAAAACVLLVGTAFAASPGLREMLAEALGGFAPYAQEQEDETYVIDGMEFQVLSVLADDFTVRAYIQVRDLEGDRLSQNTLVLGMVDVPQKGTGDGIVAGSFGGACLGYDEETKTALLSVTSWRPMLEDDLSGSTVRLFSLGSEFTDDVWTNSEGTTIPVDIKPVDSVSLSADTALASAFHAEEVRLSPVGLSVIFKADSENSWGSYVGVPVRVRLADGTVTDTAWNGGQGSFGEYGTDSARTVLTWNFRDPVDLDQVAGVYIGEDYFPIQ